MLYLRTFGGLSLEHDGSPAATAAGKRARLAILAILAAAGDRGISRERLFAILWPESDTPRARGALKQALYTLRRELRTRSLTVGAQQLRLNPETIQSDVREFETSLERNELERAVELYRGPFLDGLYLKHLAAFERWMEGERARFARQHLDALERLARSAEARGNLQDALVWWRRLATADPFNARVTLGLMMALTAAGDRAGAIQYARLHEILLREELDLAPDDSVVALAERLRTTPTSTPTVRQLDAPKTTVGDVTPAVDFSPARIPEPSVALPARRSPLGRRVAFVVTTIALLTAGLWMSTRKLRATRPDRAVIAVFPFRIAGPANNAYLREGIVDLLSRDLDGAGDLRAIDPHALVRVVRRDSTVVDDPTHAATLAGELGAGQFVLGEIIGRGDHIRINALLFDRSNGARPLIGAVVEGPPDEIFALVDKLTEQLLSGRAQGPGSRLTRTASLTTSSLAALKAYLDGEAHYAAAQYALALDSYQRAVSEDSTFALAYYRLSNAADWASRQELVLPAARLAVRFADRLSEHDRVLVKAHLDWREGDIEEAGHGYRQLVHAYPDDIEAWYQLGELLFHRNPLRGRSFTEAWGPFSRVRLFEPNNREVMRHLARIAARRANRSEIDTITSQALRNATRDDTLELRALRAFALGDPTEQDRLLRELSAADGALLYTTVWRVATYAGDLHGARRIALLATADKQPEQVQADGHEMLAQMELSLGRPLSARREIDRAATFGAAARREAIEHHALAALLPFLTPERPRHDSIVALLDSFTRARSPSASAQISGVAVHEYMCLAALLRAMAGEPVGAALSDDNARLSGDSGPDNIRLSMHACASEVRGVIAYLHGRPREALSALLAGHALVPDMRPHEPLDRFLIAESLVATGRDEEALSWYGSISDIGLGDLPYRAPSARRQAQIYARRGDRAKAAIQYRQFVDLWGDAESALQPEVRAARDSLRAWKR